MATEIKRVWIVCAMDGVPIFDPDTSDPAEFKAERAALARAKVHVKTTEDDEAWVYRLSHVVSRPDAEPDVEVVK